MMHIRQSVTWYIAHPLWNQKLFIIFVGSCHLLDQMGLFYIFPMSFLLTLLNYRLWNITLDNIDHLKCTWYSKRPLGRPRHRWEDNIKMDLQEVGYKGMDWIELAQDRDRWWALVSAVMNLRHPWNAGNFLTSWKTVSFSRRTLLHGVSQLVSCTWYSHDFSDTGCFSVISERSYVRYSCSRKTTI